MEGLLRPVGTFSDALRALLNERGMSQRELARRLGLSVQAVNGWITLGTTPARENVERLEDELVVEPRGELLHLAGYSADRAETPTVESLVRSDPGLDPEDKRVILRILRLARERHAETQQGFA
jgi:transcriptional regulator with XRE-family HTH domain